MAGRKTIINFLLVLLLSVYSSYNNAPAFCGNSNMPQASGTLSSPATPPIIYKHSIQKNHVKVRYIGGEYNYQVAMAPLVHVAIKFAGCKVFAANNFSVLSNGHFLFKLRGPPVASVSWC